MRRFMTILVLAAMATWGASPAVAAPDPAMRAAVDAFISSFNAGRPTVASCAANAIVVDDFAPYVWSGPGACAKWLAGIGQLAKMMAMSKLVVAGGKSLYVDGTAARGEVVVDARFTAQMGGKSVYETGAWTFVLTKASGTWKFAAIAWSQTGTNM